eukprot:CAMPEP_0197722688 /NCGR_PEP_ID=MMETSP1434-20131217/5286_1 /TAXON_ID=265543 /ORGANISM="Minutocellus polymorphus, Strain CCMP3303" /LENGTH=674 /DNA_ID=CAMNT_0043307875 /DNA_START=254 /DNA_END=2278 /DNA_ORIENTATION=-
MIVHLAVWEKRELGKRGASLIDNVASKAIAELLFYFEISIREKLLTESRSNRSTKGKRLVFMRSLTNTICKRCVFLEGFAVHVCMLWWHFALSVLSYCDTNPCAGANWSACNSIWGAGLKRLGMRCIRDSAAVSTGLKGRFFHVKVEGCRLLLRRCGATPTCHGAFMSPNELSDFGDLPMSVQGESQFVLAHGKTGNGKTLRCDRLLRAFDPTSLGCRAGTMRARPDLSFDLLVGTTKRWSGRLLSLQAYLELPLNLISGDSLLILDDFDLTYFPLFKALSRDSERYFSPEGSKARGSVSTRPTVTILRVMGVIRQRARDFRLATSTEGNKMLVLVTGSDDESLRATMFDQVIELKSPKEEERREAVLEYFFPEEAFSNKRGPFKESLDAIVVATGGRTWSELMRNHREVFLNELEEHGARVVVDNVARLRSIRYIVEGIAANSTRNRLTGQDDTGIKILGPNELVNLFVAYKNGVRSGALSPWEQSQSWAQLEAGILTPFCNSQDLHRLFRQGDGEAKSTNPKSIAGVLLTGASGSGKTSIARYCAAVASSLLPSLCLVEVNCVALVRKELGESERAIRQVFDLARGAAPCVMVLDGVDNIATARGKDNSTHGTMDRMLSTLLTEMDGIQGDLGQPAIVGITVESDWIDQALRRPGRLAKTIKVFNWSDRQLA